MKLRLRWIISQVADSNDSIRSLVSNLLELDASNHFNLVYALSPTQSFIFLIRALPHVYGKPLYRAKSYRQAISGVILVLSSAPGPC